MSERKWFAIGGLCLAAVLLLAVVDARAETLRFTDPDGNYLRLFEGQCSLSEVREKVGELRSRGVPDDIIAEALRELRDGELFLDGTIHKLCWLGYLDPFGTPVYGFMYSDGDEGELPAFIFSPEKI